jgi:hypothetical protein
MSPRKRVKPAIYAEKGEAVRCTNGHLICVIQKDLRVGHLPKAKDMALWMIPVPRVGDPIPNCPRCNSKWAVNGTPFGFILHVGKKWCGAQMSLEGVTIDGN